MRRMYKLIKAKWSVLKFIFKASIIMGKTKDPWERRRRLTSQISSSAKEMLRALNMKVLIKGEVPRNSYLLVGNHMSYLDIFAVSSIYPTCFVTSVEMRDTPVLGHLCRLGACVFVERRNKENIENEISEITTALEKDLMVTIFPEAKSTNGDEVLRFRKPLYNAALFAKKGVQPFCIQYKSIDGKAVTLKNRDDMCWYGDMSFGKHFLRFLGFKDVVIEIEFLTPIPYEQEKTLDDFVSSSHQQVKEAYQGFEA